ncbi:hypothetical protein YC2023_017719 [Brassica napus]
MMISFEPRVCGRVVKAFLGSSRDPSSNPHHTRFSQCVVIGTFTFSLRRMIKHSCLKYREVLNTIES